MSTEPERRVNVFNVAMGMCWIALGGLLFMERGGLIEMEQIVRLWPLALVLLGGAVVWQAARGDAGKDVPWGALVCVVILGAVFTHIVDRRPDASGDTSGFAVLNRDYAAPDGPLRGGQVTTLFGRTDIDLRGTTLEPAQTVEISVLNAFGATRIHVPAHWSVNFETTTMFGRASGRGGDGETHDSDDGDDGDDENERTGASASFDQNAGESAVAAIPPGPAPRVVITGLVAFGRVDVNR